MQVEGSAAVRTRARWTDETFDFKQSTSLRKSYIIASLPRSGSQFLSSELWKTGVLGAPCEYLFPTYDMRPMMNRLRATTLADYIAKLVACRTSANGVFGMNVHIKHFRTFLRGYPGLLDTLTPVIFIHTTRRNKVAQAVSMAKALQTSTFTSQQVKANPSPTRYNRELIERCLEDLDQQEREWEEWFASNDVTPFRLAYEDLIADRAGTVRSIMELLGVQDDEPQKIEIPPVEKQSDGTNEEWIARFEAETASNSQHPQLHPIGAHDYDVPGPGGLVDQIGAALSDSFAGSYDHFICNLQAEKSPSEAYVNLIRGRQLFQGIFEKNRVLFENARVLDVPSVDGRWGLAALDAGAAHVTGVEPIPRMAAKAARTFAEYGIGQDAYEFINADVLSALGRFAPESFDVIMCLRFFERFDPHQLFRQLHRLRPRYAILDTAIAPSRSPVLRFALRMPELAWGNATRQNANSGSIIATPSNVLIKFMCDFFGFRCHSIDWTAMAIKDWTGIHDYEQGRRQTYVLEQAV